MLLLSREDIKSVITMKDIIEADKKAFQNGSGRYGGYTASYSCQR